MSYVLDYPGIGKVFRTMGSGAYFRCMWCDLKGIFVQLKFNYNYMTRFFLGTRNSCLQFTYRIWDSLTRLDTNNFPEKSVEDRQRPKSHSYSRKQSYHETFDIDKTKYENCLYMHIYTLYYVHYSIGSMLLQ